MKIEIEDLKKFNLEKGDVLVVSYNDEIASDVLGSTMKIMEEIFPNNQILFKTTTIDLEIIKKPNTGSINPNYSTPRAKIYAEALLNAGVNKND